MKIKSLYLGDWFQRTQLHLSEIRDFLSGDPCPLDLDKRTLTKNREALGITDIHAHIGRLNSLRVSVAQNISFTIYEDGLSLFKHSSPSDLPASMKDLASFYNGPYSTAISYLFSLGAPIPKELAHIEKSSLYFLVVEKATKKQIKELLKDHEGSSYFDKSLPGFDLYRGNNMYVINQKKISDENLERFISELVFFRQFRGQLHRYLNLHRTIWEHISDVIERGTMTGSEIKPFKTKVEEYSKTINLIDTRINQMGVYIQTRGNIIKDSLELLSATQKVFSFEHETLADSLSYIKDIWKMTQNYVESSLKVFSDLQAKVLDNSVKNLTFITTLGVGATVLKLLKEDPTKLQPSGILSFGLIAVATLLFIYVLKYINLHKQYKIKNIRASKDSFK